MLPTNPQIVPGVYPGGGKAALLRAGEYAYLTLNQVLNVGQSSIAVQMDRSKSGFYYPMGVSLEVSFSGSAGTFEIDLQFSDTDQDSFYVTNSKLTTGLNASNVGRIEVTNFWALFARVNVAALGNAVQMTAKITR